MSADLPETPLATNDEAIVGTEPAATTKPAISETPNRPAPSPELPTIPPTHRPGRPGFTFRRVFTDGTTPAFETVAWEKRNATIAGPGGEVLFEQKDVEVPEDWTQLATNVVVSKYFRGNVDTEDRESSVRQLIGRVVTTITDWGKADGYFQDTPSAEAFKDDLTYLLVHQYAAFNSPVWFNVGVEERPQCSACFINSVKDSMDSILELAKTEGMLFKFGSGTGTNLSPLRSSKERLSSGGWASGPVSFMRGYDAFAGVIKSGGKTRRAAKMQILNADHPDILDFIRAKMHEEKKAHALIKSGYDGSFNGEAYNSVFFQNANFSVRATDDFMRAVEADATWATKAVNASKGQARKEVERHKAREVLHAIAEGTWQCGDPGMQYHDTVNDWNPVRDTQIIHASNPCSEYMFVDDSACNLASLNLMKFRKPDGSFDVARFQSAVNLFIIAMDILVDNSSYPTPKITVNSHEYRPLGLGYANLGALLMANSLAYDSDRGRVMAAAISSLMCGQAYLTSATLAQNIGTFKHYGANKDRFLSVIEKHRQASYRINELVPAADNPLSNDLSQAATQVWDRAYEHGCEHGYRNAQVTVLAPTGTIGFMMDCDTTGIEPDIALIKYKNLVGGGMLKIVNQTVPEALQKLGYVPDQVKAILDYIEDQETIEGAPGIKPEHLPIFDCAFKPANGVRSIHHLGHVRMMAAVQPFLSGAISKTVNMPETATVEEIEQVYLLAWKLGLKAIAIYRDNSKWIQPLQTSKGKDETREVAQEVLDPQQVLERATQSLMDAAKRGEYTPIRRRLPDERVSFTHKFTIAGHEGYLTVGLFPDGKPGELFIKMAKEGSVVSGLMDSFATAVSIMLQYGVPLDVLVQKFSHSRFEPSGVTNNPRIRFAKSIMDYIFRWFALKFLDTDDAGNVAESSRTRVLQVKVDDDGELTVGKTTKDLPYHGVHSVTTKLHTPNEAARRDNAMSQTQVSITSATSQQAATPTAPTAPATAEPTQVGGLIQGQQDAPPCPECGAIMVRNGACYLCRGCGTTSGCS